MVQASLQATMPLTPDPDDTRCKAAREFNLFIELLTGSATPGTWHASVLVPFHTATGGDLELADLPDLGPVLPSTARALLQRATCPSTGGGLTRISLNQHGRVISLDTPRAHPTSSTSSTSSTQAPEHLDLTQLLAAFTVPRSRRTWALAATGSPSGSGGSLRPAT